jgi:hypothetical protein
MLKSGKTEPWLQEEHWLIWNDNLGFHENPRQRLSLSIVQLSGGVIRKISAHLGSDGAAEES